MCKSFLFLHLSLVVSHQMNMLMPYLFIRGKLSWAHAWMNSRTYHNKCMTMLLIVWCGENDDAILGACSIDLMHAFLHSLISYIMRIIIGSFSTTDKHKCPFGPVRSQNIQEQILSKEFQIWNCQLQMNGLGLYCHYSCC